MASRKRRNGFRERFGGSTRHTRKQSGKKNTNTGGVWWKSPLDEFNFLIRKGENRSRANSVRLGYLDRWLGRGG